MRQICLLLFISSIFIACKKDHVPFDDQVNAYLQPGKTDTANIIGSWELFAFRRIIVNRPAPGWNAPDPAKKVIINFKTGGVFSYNANYKWPAPQYNRFNFISSGIDSGYFRLSSTSTNPLPPTLIKMPNANALLITYLGVDTDDEEVYIHAQSQQ